MSIYDKASLVLIPSGTKTSKVYSQKPTNGDGDFTFSRSTAATRVNASGNIEKETQNLLLQSNFSSSWSAPVATMTGGQSGYDGSSDAWLLSATGNFARIEQTNSSSGVVTLSVYAKAGTADWIMLRLTGSGFNDQQYFDLANGAVGINRGCIAADIEDVGGGWYRCSATTSGPTLQYAIMYIALADGNLSPTNENIYIQDAQLEQGLVARDYIETTTTAIYGGITDNVPRLDYTDSSCPALLLEPQRTNLVRQSEYFGGNEWTKQSSVSITGNTHDSPEGIANASTLTFNNTSNQLFDYISATSGTIYTSSVFVKYKTGTSRDIKIGMYDVGWKVLQINFATDGTIDSTSEIGTLVDSGYDDYGDGWYRVYVTWTSSSTATKEFNINRVSLSTTSVEEFYIYGAQLEQDATYPTSYIPTYGSAVTRNVDAAYDLSAADLIGNDEGVFFIDVKTPSAIASNTTFSIGGGTNGEYAQLEIRTDLSINWRYRQGSTDYINANVGSYVAGDRLKLAFAYKNGSSILYKNGSSIATDNGSINTNAWDEIRFSNFAGTGNLNASVNQALLFKTRLTNEELADLTTL